MEGKWRDTIPPPRVADARTASPADASKKPWAKPVIRTVDGEVGSGADTQFRENARYRPAS